LQVRDTLEERRRRGAELRALYETANDLAALRDLDAVLAAIVHRARQLLSTDVAYLSLNDPERGDTYMRVTDGSVSSLFRQVRLPMGAGLGGLVAQSATPYATASYFEDERFAHTHGIDSAVLDEGLVAILGVPLVLGDHVLGVLYAANRTARPFARTEVSLLVSLAAHAAIAIDSARLLDEMRQAVSDLETAHTLVAAHSRSVERAADAHDRFTGLVLRGGGVDDVAASVAEVLGGPVLVLDEESRLVAASPEAPTSDVVDKNGRLLSSLRAVQAQARESGRTVQHQQLWMAPVVAGSSQLGDVVLVGHDELEEADQRILERAALVTALLLVFRRATAEAEQRVAGELLNELVQATDRDPVSFNDRAKLLGVDLSGELALVVARCPAEQRHRAALAAAHLASTHHGLSAVHGDHLDLLLPAADGGPGAAAQLVARELAKATGVPVTCGGAAPGGTSVLDELPSCHDEAARCADTMLALGRRGQGGDAGELGFVGFVLGEHRDVGQFVRSQIGALVEYDERRGTQLVATLVAYFASQLSPARASQTLHVHVNTVTQRLDRIGQLLGDDWQEPERALELQVALRLHRLLG
ncbi:MAG TPA: helix-turn-helix domain-containing protein, partial [Actinomycetales bacterium]|nr:helix-turn-helix domain-containing protein [Actinomycetales bacterium]